MLTTSRPPTVPLLVPLHKQIAFLEIIITNVLRPVVTKGLKTDRENGKTRSDVNIDNRSQAEGRKLGQTQ